MKEFMTKWFLSICQTVFHSNAGCAALAAGMSGKRAAGESGCFSACQISEDKGENVNCVEDVLAAYAEPVLLSENGYTVFMLKTVGADDACIF